MDKAVIATNPARCRDCYRCVRNCEVKAIKIKDGQAQVVPELCILCGMCVRSCPQKAKGVRSSISDVKQAKLAGQRLIASVAPSAPAYFDMACFAEMEEALISLGFYAAEETAVGAEVVGRAHREYVEQNTQNQPVITSSCPVVVNLIEQYHPDMIPYLAPIVSPMIAHGRMLQRKYGADARIVFIGPCIAKKQEMYDESVSDAVHFAITFRGLQEWLTASGISWRASARPAADMEPLWARLFPVEGGLVRTAQMDTDILNSQIVIASGLNHCQDVLNDIRAGYLQKSCLVELMACKGGCINGPAMADIAGGIYPLRQKVMDYHANRPGGIPVDREEWPLLARTYRDRKQIVPEFSDEQIQEVLRRVNKHTLDDELNCGACGYSSCREKAAATLRGMAEATMCIPYMRHRSESLRQVVMDVSPNAIVIIDDTLTIQDISPSAERLFNRSLHELKGKHLSSMISVLDDFLYVRDTGDPVIGKIGPLTDELIAEQHIVRVEGQTLLVAIIRDMTEQNREKKKFHALRAETLDRTWEVVHKQMRVAHEIAHLLGETTAESKMIVSRLAKLLDEEGLK